MLKYRYSIVACARWETPYIHEWIAYHRAIGFDHIYICCNDDDPAAFNEEVFRCSPPGFVTLFVSPVVGEQWQMYTALMDVAIGESDWVAFLDIDEFLVLRGVDDVSAFMARFPAKLDSVLFNWLVFGNNGFLERPPGSVLRQYTRRAADLDHHTKHITRARALTRDKLLSTRFPFWHGLANPHWSDLRRMNVLGEEWGNYFDGFPATASQALADTDTARLLGTAAVHHYMIKSEADLLWRQKRSSSGQFSNQSYWARLMESGAYKTVLSGMNVIEDTYLKNFAEAHQLPCHAVPAARHDRAFEARHRLWEGKLVLDAEGRIRHVPHGTAGDYVIDGDALTVTWDAYGQERFIKHGEVYVEVGLLTGSN